MQACVLCIEVSGSTRLKAIMTDSIRHPDFDLEMLEVLMEDQGTA